MYVSHILNVDVISGYLQNPGSMEHRLTSPRTAISRHINYALQMGTQMCMAMVKYVCVGGRGEGSGAGK